MGAVYIKIRRQYLEDSVHSERDSSESAMAAVIDGTPIQYKDAMKSKVAHKWKEAMDIEIENIRRNKTYTLKRTKHGEKVLFGYLN
jgi:hypothetical protein